MSARLVDALRVGGPALAMEAVCGGVDVLATGALGMGAPLLGMGLGTTIGLVLQVRRSPAWLTRERLRQVAVDVGGVHFVGVGLAYAGGAGVQGFALVVGMAALGLLGALAAGAVVMCAGDGVAMVMCPFPEVGSGDPGSGPAGPWRRR